jgi:hypothetical protein
MNFVNEEHIMGLKARENGREIARPFDNGTGGRFETDTELTCENPGERGLSKTWWAVQKNVVERLSSPSRGLAGDEKVLFNIALANI